MCLIPYLFFSLIPTDIKYIENIRSHDSSVQYSVSCYRYTPHSTGSSAVYDWGEASVSLRHFVRMAFAVLLLNICVIVLFLFMFP